MVNLGIVPLRRRLTLKGPLAPDALNGRRSALVVALGGRNHAFAGVVQCRHSCSFGVIKCCHGGSSRVAEGRHGGSFGVTECFHSSSSCVAKGRQGDSLGAVQRGHGGGYGCHEIQFDLGSFFFGCSSEGFFHRLTRVELNGFLDNNGCLFDWFFNNRGFDSYLFFDNGNFLFNWFDNGCIFLDRLCDGFDNRHIFGCFFFALFHSHLLHQGTKNSHLGFAILGGFGRNFGLLGWFSFDNWRRHFFHSRGTQIKGFAAAAFGGRLLLDIGLRHNRYWFWSCHIFHSSFFHYCRDIVFQRFFQLGIVDGCHQRLDHGIDLCIVVGIFHHWFEANVIVLFFDGRGLFDRTQKGCHVLVLKERIVCLGGLVVGIGQQKVNVLIQIFIVNLASTYIAPSQICNVVAEVVAVQALSACQRGMRDHG